MKSALIALIAFIGSCSAYAGSTICAGPGLYYNTTRNDFAAEIPPGTLIGSDLIVYDGQVLIRNEVISGLGQFFIDAYKVQIQPGGKLIETSGDKNKGSKIVKTVGVIYSVDVSQPLIKTEIGREEILCTISW